jgi:hypothetical protein
MVNICKGVFVLKKYLILLATLFLLVACGSNEEKAEPKVEPKVVETKTESKEPIETSTDVTIEEYENRISKALKQMGNKTNLKILSSEKQEDGKTVITLSENVMIFLTTNKKDIIENIALGVMPDTFFTDKDDFQFSFLLLVGTADDSLSMGERNLVLKELGLDDEENFTKEHTASYRNNDISYTYKGSIKENFILQAEYK